MEIKLNDLLIARSALVSLANAKGLSAVIAYHISKDIKLINEEIKNYEETRTKLIEEKANKNEDGNPIIEDDAYSLSNESLVYVEKELNSLLNESIDLDIKKISLNDIDKAGLSPLEISSIEFMLEV